jgi:hypothetical protein
MNSNEFKWEMIDRTNASGNISVITWRARVPGGWLVKVSEIISLPGLNSNNHTVNFIADQKYTWELKPFAEVNL